MKKLSLLALGVALSALFGLQFADSQPQPPPSQWVTNGNTIAYSKGGVDGPAGVAGGSKGVGALNFTKIYSGGVQIFPYGSYIAGYSVAINCNTTATDYAIPLSLPTANYEIVAITLVHSSGTAGLATVGVFSATAGGGTQLAQTTAVPSGTGANTTTVTSRMNLNSIVPSAYFNYTTLYARAVVASGSACGASLYIEVKPLP